MATLVCLHAHPDDEAISTGGTISRAAAEGHRVVLVVATNGDHGEVPADLGDGESLVDRRRAETMAAADHLGIARVAWLGYSDSGMTGWHQNDHDHSLHQAPVEEAAEKLAAILRQEDADVLTSYDWHGTYGHPDHVKVHLVGARAAELAGVRLLEATMNRDAMHRLVDVAREEGVDFGSTDDEDFDPSAPADDGNPFGEPEEAISLEVDVTEFVARKKAALACHASQVSDSDFFVNMADEAFARAFGTEWFIEPGAPGPMRRGWILDGYAT